MYEVQPYTVVLGRIITKIMCMYNAYSAVYTTFPQKVRIIGNATNNIKSLKRLKNVIAKYLQCLFTAFMCLL